MKTHYGFMENYGDYESPMWGCDITACGCTGEKAIENATGDWDEVDCLNCLKVKNRVIEERKKDEEHIINDMGMMAEFFKKEQEKNYVEEN